MLKSRFSAGASVCQAPISMATEGIQLVRRQWWCGLLVALAGVSVLFAVAGRASALSFAMGMLAVMLGGVLAGWYSFRHVAPSGSEAAVSFVVASGLRWLVVLAVLVAAFRAPDVQPLWVVIGVVLSQLSSVAAAMTFKRR